MVSGEHANFEIAFKSEEKNIFSQPLQTIWFAAYEIAVKNKEKPLQAIWFAHLRDDEGLSEQEIYDWCVR